MYIYSLSSTIACLFCFASSFACSGPIVPPPPTPPPNDPRGYDPRGFDPYSTGDNIYASVRSRRSLGNLQERESPPRFDNLVPSHTGYATQHHVSQDRSHHHREQTRHSTGSMPVSNHPGDMPISFVDDVIERPLNDTPQRPPLQRHITPPEYRQVYPHGGDSRNRPSSLSDSMSPPLSSPTEEGNYNTGVLSRNPTMHYGIYVSQRNKVHCGVT